MPNLKQRLTVPNLKRLMHKINAKSHIRVVWDEAFSPADTDPSVCITGCNKTINGKNLVLYVKVIPLNN